MKINVWHNIEQRTVDASIGQWHSWLMPKANILNAWCKWICVEKNEAIGSLVNIYPYIFSSLWTELTVL